MQSIRCRVSGIVFLNHVLMLIERIDYAITNKLTPFTSMQNHYSLLYREEEREMFPTLKVSSIIRPRLMTVITLLILGVAGGVDVWRGRDTVVAPCARNARPAFVC